MSNGNERFVNPEMTDGGLVNKPTLQETAQYTAGVEPGKYDSNIEAMALGIMASTSSGESGWFRDAWMLGSPEMRLSNVSEPASYPTYGSLGRGVYAEVDEPIMRSRERIEEAQRRMAMALDWTTGAPAERVNVCVLTAEEEAATEPSRDELERYTLQVETLADDLTSQLAIEVEDLCGYSLLRKKLKLASPLKRCLADLGIEPLRLSMVNAYKAEMILFHRAEMKRNKTWTAFSKMSWVDHSLRDCSQIGIEVPEFVLSRCVAISKSMNDSNVAVSFIVEKLADVDPFLRVQTGDEHFYTDVWGESRFEATL